MKKICFLLALFFVSGIIQSCSTTQPLDNEPGKEIKAVATIQNSPITFEELKKGYTGNIENDSVSTVELRNFLPSYVDYRLKILEGRQLGYFENPDIQSEYRAFAKEAAEKLWMNNEIESRIVNTFIQRSRKELRAFHILITTNNPGYEESKEIKNQLRNARKEILEGADPDSVNIKYSSMQNGNYAGGSLPWITAGRTVKSFEDVLYSLESGEVSQPFQTQFGFHIIYLMDERPRTMERFVRHIFVSKQGSENPEQTITEALDSLRNGVDWSDVVNEFSEDRRTASRAGEIGWVGYGMQFPEPFVDKVVDASSITGPSDIIEMDYGFHIIQVDSVRDLSDQTALEEYAKSELDRLGRLQPGEDELYDMLKEYGNFQLFDEEFELVADYLFGTSDTIDEGKEIAEFNETPVLAEQFIEFYEQEIGSNSEEDVSINGAFEQFTDRLIESNLIELTKERFDNYRYEMEQFLNGLVVFKVNEEFLWNPDAADEKMLKDHFEQNREIYKTDKTISYYRITATSDSAIASAKSNILEYRDPENLENEFDNIIVRTGNVSNRNSDLFQLLNSLAEGELSEIENNETWNQFYYITKVVSQRLKSFDEAKADVFNELRDRHESDFLKSLREKYQTEMYPDNVQ